ncbi:MAG: DUF1475 domain-containing protein [Acidobacteria bacterium]|nr:DUF1475 domain-containing protein [Acidobacteriota bacterium]
MRSLLIALFGAIFVSMIFVTVRTSLEMPIWEAFATFGDNPWSPATLWDAYFGFLTFYVWVSYKEPKWLGRIVWFVLIMTLGNIAMSLYVLIQLFSLEPDQEPWTILVQRRANESV